MFLTTLSGLDFFFLLLDPAMRAWLRFCGTVEPVAMFELKEEA